MKTLDLLLDPVTGPLYWPGILTALAIVVLTAPLSILVVLKRMAFIGQGVSHAAFGGVGVAAALGLAMAPTPGLAHLAVVLGFCLLAAAAMALLSERGAIRVDTAIGVMLAGSMALGGVLLSVSRTSVSWESFLFGSLFGAGWPQALAIVGLALGVLAWLWWVRRPLLVWALEESTAATLGVKVVMLRVGLVLALAVATVATMRVAGVVLATAMLVVPGAAALGLGRTLRGVVLLSLLVSALSVLIGLVVSFEANWPPGPSIVLIQTALLVISRGVARGRR